MRWGGLYGHGTEIDKIQRGRKSQERVTISWGLTEFDLSSLLEARVAAQNQPCAKAHSQRGEAALGERRGLCHHCPSSSGHLAESWGRGVCMRFDSDTFICLCQMGTVKFRENKYLNKITQPICGEARTWIQVSPISKSVFLNPSQYYLLGWSSGSDFTRPVQGTWVRPLVRELDSICHD